MHIDILVEYEYSSAIGSWSLSHTYAAARIVLSVLYFQK